MTSYIENVNKYMKARKIKQSYVCMQSGMDAKKLSRILTGAQDVVYADMEVISSALGKNVEYFIGESLAEEEMKYEYDGKVYFHTGNPTKRQKELADMVINLFKCMDEVLGAEKRFMNMEDDYEY